MTHKQPTTLFEWKNDIPNDDLHCVMIYDNNKVVLTSGRGAYTTACMPISWTEFVAGEMNEPVIKSMGLDVFNEVIKTLKSLQLKNE